MKVGATRCALFTTVYNDCACRYRASAKASSPTPRNRMYVSHRSVIAVSLSQRMPPPAHPTQPRNEWGQFGMRIRGFARPELCAVRNFVSCRASLHIMLAALGVLAAVKTEHVGAYNYLLKYEWLKENITNEIDKLPEEKKNEKSKMLAKLDNIAYMQINASTETAYEGTKEVSSYIRSGESVTFYGYVNSISYDLDSEYNIVNNQYSIVDTMIYPDEFCHSGDNSQNDCLDFVIIVTQG